MLRGVSKPNANGGIFHPGRRYELPKKMEVGVAFLELVEEKGGARHVSVKNVSKRAKVSWYYAKAVMKEYKETDYLTDPFEVHDEILKARATTLHLHVEEEMFLLALRAESPKRPNIDYIKELYETYGRVVSSSFISRWFKKRFEFRGDFKKPNLVPLDKWRPTNITSYLEYRMKMEQLPHHHLYNFLDEKHLANKDAIEMKGRVDPLTGQLDCIPVSGDFRETYNLMAVISANPDKQKHVEYHIDKQNGDAVAFYCFICYLITVGWFLHNEILIMDNTRIHTGGAAKNVANLLWETVIDGLPLHVLVIYLPTRSPELNPIELIFHILARRIRSYRYQLAGPSDQAVVKNAKRVLDEMSYELILKCYVHCGY
jgi:hypothetical protein